MLWNKTNESSSLSDRNICHRNKFMYLNRILYQQFPKLFTVITLLSLLFSWMIMFRIHYKLCNKPYTFWRVQWLLLVDFSIADETSGTSVRKSYHIESYSLNDTNYILYHIHFKIQTHPKLAWKIKSTWTNESHSNRSQYKHYFIPYKFLGQIAPY